MDKGFGFRLLRADEIEARVSQISKKGDGVQLLLYKNARCDMNILDETVGAANWQRKHYDCKGNLFCSVGIRIGNEWIWKDDCGEESNQSAEKGEASDSFKRACVNWGIGRELYTAPFLWVPAEKTNIVSGQGGKFICKDRFSVEKIAYDDQRRIVGVSILNSQKQRAVVSSKKEV